MIEVTSKNSEIIPLGLEEANRFVAMFHRHNKKVKLGGKFAIGLMYKGELIGVAIAGIPRARMLNDGKTIEILRVCVKDGYKNANSILYGRMKRICQLMGYKRIVTYTLKKESGSSLRASGFKPVKEVKPQVWDRPSRRRKFQKVYLEPKIRWEYKAFEGEIE